MDNVISCANMWHGGFHLNIFEQRLYMGYFFKPCLMAGDFPLPPGAEFDGLQLRRLVKDGLVSLGSERGWVPEGKEKKWSVDENWHEFHEWTQFFGVGRWLFQIVSRGNVVEIKMFSFHAVNFRYTSSTAQGGGGSFKNRKPIREVGCCESRMAEWSLSFSLLFSFSDYLPIYLSIDLPINQSIYLSFYLPIYLSIDLPINLSIYLSIYLPIYLSIYL